MALGSPCHVRCQKSPNRFQTPSLSGGLGVTGRGVVSLALPCCPISAGSVWGDWGWFRGTVGQCCRSIGQHGGTMGCCRAVLGGLQGSLQSLWGSIWVAVGQYWGCGLVRVPLSCRGFSLFWCASPQNSPIEPHRTCEPPQPPHTCPIDPCDVPIVGGEGGLAGAHPPFSGQELHL